MSNTIRKGLGRRVAMVGALIAAILAFGASSAFATINLAPEGPYSSTKSTSVKASGTAPAGAELVAVAVCNASFSPGTHCDFNSVSGGGALESVAAYEKGLKISVRRGVNSTTAWTSFDFTSGEPKATTPPTLCTSESAPGLTNEAPCKVEASFYKEVGGIPVPVGGDERAITFTP
jgi:hypothetical protein